MRKSFYPCEDLTERTFGLLTVLSRCDYSMTGAIWRCKCACGNEVDVRATQLRNGNRKSCGCLNRKQRRSA